MSTMTEDEYKKMLGKKSVERNDTKNTKYSTTRYNLPTEERNWTTNDPAVVSPIQQ